MRAVTQLEALGERTIWIDCDVIQADGGTRTASISGGFVALVLALQRLKERGPLKQIPITDYVAATSVGILAAPYSSAPVQGTAAPACVSCGR